MTRHGAVHATPATWRVVERVVDAALDAPAADRARVVAERCRGDLALQAAALAWLRACEREEDPFPTPLDITPLHASLAISLDALDSGERDADDDADPADDADQVLRDTRLGPWRLTAEIGRGGMGTVYLAEREDVELPMRVALKLLRGGRALDPLGGRRFREERRILATLDHPAIARLLDGGVTDDGVPWFAMEYVAGAPIDAWCDERALPVEARLRLFADVCDAVAHAHTRLIVHRDLKPANVLVSDEGAVKLLDFGIAKLLTPGDASDPGLTLPGAQPMTPAYASPEQLRGEPASTAADVYALGVLLHVLLTGHLPFGAGRDGAAALERRIRTGGAVRASTAVHRARRDGRDADDAALPARLAAARGTTPARLQQRLRGDLDTIVARAMHPDPAGRYATAHALADDVRRHLERRPVLARPDSLAYRARLLLRRHPAASAAVAAGLVVALGFSTVTAMQAAALREQAVRLTAERDKATEVTAFLSALLSSADPYQDGGRVPTLREVLDRGAEQAARSLGDRPAVRAHLLTAMAPAYFGMGDWERAGAMAEESVALRRAARAPQPELAAALVYLASVQLNRGRATEAEAHAREALVIVREHHGVAGLDTARVLSALGAALQKQGKLAEAEEVLRTVREVESARQPRSERQLAQAARNLAHVLRDRGDHAEAAPLYAEAFVMHRVAFGDEHPETANSLVNLGAAHARLGDLAGAERLLALGVATKRRLLGIRHPDVAQDQLVLARVVEERGRTAEAAALRDEAQAVLDAVRAASGTP